MLINPIASGSSGNAYYISDGQSSLLLDAGIPLAQIQAGCGYKVSQLSGCLVTHGHGDHVKAAKALARIPLRIWDSVDKSINIMGERGNTPPGQAGEHENYGKNGLRYGSHVYDRFL